MDSYYLSENLNVMGFPVKTFPDGIGEAFDSMIATLPGGLDRAYYGISYVAPEGIVYIAAAVENYPGEAEQHNYQRYFIEKGEYFTVTVKDWRRKTHTIKDVFADMLPEHCPDARRPCVEWYKNDDEMLCMVRKEQQDIRVSK